MHDQAEANFRWFKSQRAHLAKLYAGQHALLHDQSVDGYFRSSMEAIRAGMERHGEGNFSVEPVEDAPEDLGFYSHVGAALRA
jgi:hypothetical protein